MDPILFYTFLGIFIVTAILTLLSLPDWIKIPKNYKKVLFSSLIVEVIGCVILLFKQEMEIKYTLEPAENWVAIQSNNASVVHPDLRIGTEDIVLGQSEEEAQKNLRNNQLKLAKEGDEWLVGNANNAFYWGRLSKEELQHAGFYNGLEAWQNEIPSSDNYKVIKFVSNDGKRTWQQKGSFANDCPLKIEVYTTNEIGYRIINVSNNKVEFDSKNESQNVINLDHRKLHFLEIEHVFYLIRITQADLSRNRGENYIHFMMVKLQPQLSS